MMTDAIESWLTPLLFISAPALMILSIAARYAQLHGEIHFLQDHGYAGAGRDVCNTALRKRAICFRNALVALYSAIVIFAIDQPAGCDRDELVEPCAAMGGGDGGRRYWRGHICGCQSGAGGCVVPAHY